MNAKEIYEEVRSLVNQIIIEDKVEENNTDLYMVAQECCYGLNKSELLCLANACQEIVADRDWQ